MLLNFLKSDDNKEQPLSLSSFQYQQHFAAIFSGGGIVVTFFFTLTTLSKHLYGLAAVLFIACLFLCLSFHIVSSKKHSHFYSITRHITLLGLSLLGMYLVYSGGVNNTGPLWIFVIPPVMLALSGIQIGFLYISSFVVLVCTMLLYPDNALLHASYSDEFKSRLLFSFVISCTISCYYEAARYKSYRELSSMSTQFKRESRQDELTKLPNRRSMWITLQHEKNQLSDSQSAIIALIDVDFFKNVNDTYGHDIGDEVLKHLSIVIKNSLRSQDTLARWGGEEFLLMMPNTSREDADKVLNIMRKAVYDMPYIYQGQQIPLSISAGFCELSNDIQLNNAMKFADDCLYQAKATGRNKVIGNTQL